MGTARSWTVVHLKENNHYWHNENGPAYKFYCNGKLIDERYYINSESLSEEEFNKYRKNKAFDNWFKKELKENI